jgi:hypothetical protein
MKGSRALLPADGESDAAALMRTSKLRDETEKSAMKFLIDRVFTANR